MKHNVLGHFELLVATDSLVYVSLFLSSMPIRGFFRRTRRLIGHIHNAELEIVALLSGSLFKRLTKGFLVFFTLQEGMAQW